MKHNTPVSVKKLMLHNKVCLDGRTIDVPLNSSETTMTIQSLKKQLEAINGCQEESMQLWQEEHESELADDESISAGETVYLLIDKTELIIEHKHGEWSSKDLSNIHDLETLLDGVVEYNKVSIRMLLDDRDADRGGNDIWRDNITILNKLVKCTELVSLELELGDLSMQEGGGEDEQLDDLDQQLDKIKTIVRNNKHLKKFHLKRTDIHPAGEKILAKELVNNRSLTDLQLSNVGMITWDDGGCLDLCKSGIFSRLKKLDLSNNLYIWDAESPNNNFLENLGKYLKDNSSITELNLAWNCVGDCVGDQAQTGATTFMNSIPTMSSLTRLILSNNSFRVHGYELLAAELKKTKSLKELDMSDNGLGLYPTAMRLLLKDNTFITALDLSSNQITANGSIELAKVIPTMRALVSANLLNNDIGTEQAQNLATVLKDHATLKSLCGNKGDETVLDMSGKKMGADDVIMLAPEIVANGALVSANLLNNEIGVGQAHNLATTLKDHATLKSLCGNKGDETVLDMSGKKMGADDVIMLAPEIVANGALVKFDISNNGLCAAGVKLLAKALKGNQIMTEINLSRNSLGVASPVWLLGNDDSDMSGVIAIINAIATMRALTSLNMSENRMASKEAGKALGEMLKQNSVLQELDVSRNFTSCNEYELPDTENRLIDFTTGIADGLRTNEVLAKLIFDVHYGSRGYRNLPESVTLQVGMTEADLSDTHLGVGGARIVSAWISRKNNGEMTKLNISNNELYESGTKAIAQALKGNSIMTELNIAGNDMENYGAMDISKTIPTMGALVKFDISNNFLEADGCKTIAEALRGNNILKELNIATNSIVHSRNTWEMSAVNALANTIPTMGALEKLVFGGDRYQKDGIWVYSEPATLEVGMKEIDLSNKNLRRGVAMIVGAWISHKDNGALVKLIFGGDRSDKWDSQKREYINHDPAVLEVGMTEADLSDKGLGVGEAFVVGAWLSHKDKGALKSLNIKDNNLCAAGGKALAESLTNNQVLTSLDISGNRIHGAEAGEALGGALAANTVLKELDLSDQGYADGQFALDAEFAKKFAVGLATNSKLVKLDISRNRLYADGAEVLAGALNGNQVLQDLNIAENHLGVIKKTNKRGDNIKSSSGLSAISQAISTMGAITSLNISNNRIQSPIHPMHLGWRKKKGKEIYININTGDTTAKEPEGDKTGFIKFTDALKNHTKLETLRMNNNHIDNECIGDFIKALGNNEVIQDIDLSHNTNYANTDSMNQKMIQTILDTIRTMAKLRTLNLDVEADVKQRIKTILDTHARSLSDGGAKRSHRRRDRYSVWRRVSQRGTHVLANSSRRRLPSNNNNKRKRVTKRRSWRKHVPQNKDKRVNTNTNRYKRTQTNRDTRRHMRSNRRGI